MTRRELLAIVRAISHFKYYLCGLPFTVRTDHSALQWLMSFTTRRVKVAGTRHANADAMSRCPCPLNGCRYCEKREIHEKELCVEAPYRM